MVCRNQTNLNGNSLAKGNSCSLARSFAVRLKLCPPNICSLWNYRQLKSWLLHCCYFWSVRNISSDS